MYKLATEGDRSISKLSKKPLNRYRTSFVKSIKVLEKLEMVKPSLKGKRPKGMEAPYKITDKGIEVLSRNQRITLEQFWEISFCIFDKKRNSKITFEEFSTNYKKSVRKYNPKLSIFGWGIVFEHFDLLCGMFIESEEQIEILKFLANRKNTTCKILTQHLKKKYPSIYKNILEHKFIRLIQDKLIFEIRNSSNFSFRIIALIKYYRKCLDGVSDGDEHKRIGKEVTEIKHTMSYDRLLLNSINMLVIT
ncbi:MAG: hypothetical protein IIB02_01015 [Thaumarchaeota archaeon]|nr:hypothetical protein [Nitrososphaerota archaeon]